MSHFDLRRFEAIPDLPSSSFFDTLPAFDYFFSYFISIIYSSPIFLLFSKLRESTQRMAILTRREVDDGPRATLRFLSKVDSFPLFQSWFKGSEERFMLLAQCFNTRNNCRNIVHVLHKLRCRLDCRSGMAIDMWRRLVKWRLICWRESRALSFPIGPTLPWKYDRVSIQVRRRDCFSNNLFSTGILYS